jgi:hypothetical protein
VHKAVGAPSSKYGEIQTTWLNLLMDTTKPLNPFIAVKPHIPTYLENAACFFKPVNIFIFVLDMPMVAYTV